MNASLAPASLAQELQCLDELLARQRDALLKGDADGLRRLAEQLHGRLCALQSARPRPLAPADQGQLQALRQRVSANQQLLQARQAHLRNALAALMPAAHGIATATYEAAGQLAGAASPGRAFARA